MPNKLAGIVGCLILAALVNVGIKQGIGSIENRASFTVFDGSSYSSSSYSGPSKFFITSDSVNTDLHFLAHRYMDYVASGTGESWLSWRRDFDNLYGDILSHPGPPSPQWSAQVLRVQDNSAPAKWIALLTLIVALLILWSDRLKEYQVITPIFYLAVASLALWTYGALSAPLFMAVSLLGILIYVFSIRLMLPLYRTEWTRSMRPLLTFCLVLLGAIAWRGPEWVDYQFWTSDLFRLIILATAFFSLFFHWVILSKALENAKLEVFARVFGYAMPLGTTVALVGLFLGFWGKGDDHALIQLNRELLVLPPDWLQNVDPNLPFWLLFAGFTLVIIGGIGYLIQRIAR